MPSLLDIFSPDSQSMTVAKFLDRSPYDELAEIDLIENRCRNIYHVEGKFFVPLTNGSFLDLYDYTVDNMVHPDDRNVFAQLFEPDTLAQRLSESSIPGALSAQFRYRLQDGGWRWTEVCLVGGPNQGLPEHIVRFFIFDIENLIVREGNKIASYHVVTKNNRDSKTGLLQEDAFLMQLHLVIESQADAPWSLVVIDIDHFSLFNEWYGREAGDFLLAEIGARLSAEEEAGGLACYRGRDDFCIALPFDKHRIDTLFEDIIELISSRGAATGFTPVFGISLAKDATSDFELLDQATLAAENAKRDFRKRICLFHAPMREQEEQEYRVLSRFLHALDNSELFFQLQPQCHATTRKIVGAEALARWRRPDGTMVSPIDFIPALERHGFITNLDCYIWEEVCAWLQTWIQSGHKPVPISVNVSQVDFYSIDVPAYFEKLVGEYQLDPSLIKIEITESAYMDDTAMINDATKRLRESGFLVLMDDFGSGYSSLNALGNLNVDVIKLDAQFLHTGSNEDHKGIHILESVINMTNILSLPIICEGVETEEQLAFLEKQGCRYIQGYLFYRPIDVEQFESIIADEQMTDIRELTPATNEQFQTRELFDKNIYSDTMLNSILGAVALYSWDGNDVNIIRFNEEFQQAIHARNFDDNLQGIQRLMPDAEAPKLYDLLTEAEKNQFTGSHGTLQFSRFDGSPCYYLFHFFYLGMKDGRKRFYGAVRDVTMLTMLEQQARLITDLTPHTIVLVRNRMGDKKCDVITHGLEGAVGLTPEEWQMELNSHTFFSRVQTSMAGDLERMIFNPGATKAEMPFTMKSADGEPIEVHVQSYPVDGEPVDVAAVLVFSK